MMAGSRPASNENLQGCPPDSDKSTSSWSHLQSRFSELYRNMQDWCTVTKVVSPPGQPETSSGQQECSLGQHENSSGQQDNSSYTKVVQHMLPAAVVVGAGGAAIAAVPLVISAAGFGAGGITAGSSAASWMSAAATSGIGMAAVSTFQSAGAAGLALSTKALIGAAGAYAGSGIAKYAFGKPESNNAKE